MPETRAPGSTSQRTIQLPVAIVGAKATAKRPDPVVIPTTGGPGSSSFRGLWMLLEYDWASRERDGIIIEQRGDLLAQPALTCPELNGQHLFAAGRSLAPPEADAVHRNAVRACHDRLIAEGIDLSAYNSTESAADLADLRRALGYNQWNLYGLSYGSRLGLTVMRDQPAGLRSVILDGVDPPDSEVYRRTPASFAQAVRRMAADCAADSECAARYPDVEGQLADLLERTRSSPITVGVRAPWDASAVTVAINDTDIAGGMFGALYDDNQTRALPFAIDQLARGNTDVAVPFAQQNLDYINFYTEGLSLSADCAEELPFYGTAPVERPSAVATHLRADRGAATCADWPVQVRPEIENQTVHSDIPALLLNGGRDPITPPEFGHLAARGLSRHWFVEFPTMGHGAVWHLWSNDCPASIASRFLDDPLQKPDTACVAAMPPLDFITTDDVYPSPAIYRLNSEVIEGRDPAQRVFPAVALLGLVAGLAYGIAGLGRKPATAPRWGAPAALTASVLGLAFTGLLTIVVLISDPLVLGFGLPSIWRPWLTGVGLVTLMTSAVLAAVVIRAWLRRSGSAAHRVTLTAVAAVAVAFDAWLVTRGLLFL